MKIHDELETKDIAIIWGQICVIAIYFSQNYIMTFFELQILQ